MAPLGILTAIVGAIRVDGANWLKRLIGRARENTADAEIELMSSVSQEVCEVWNGTSIVRSMGSPQVKQIIHLPAKKGDFSPESFITMDRKTWSSGYELKARYWSSKDTGSEKLSTNEDIGRDIEAARNERTVHSLGEEELIKNKDIPPNISLNVHGGSNPVEVGVYALTASALQAAVLVWSHHALKHKLSGSKPSVGFPLQVAGTVLLTLVLILCAGIIDNGSRERHWLMEEEVQVETASGLLSFAKSKFKALANKLRLAKGASLQEKKHRHMQLYWVQKQHIAGDNSFDPYILYAEELNDKVNESHRAKENGQNDRDDQVHESPKAKENGQNDRDDTFLRKLLRPFGHHLTTFAVVIGLLGFVAQFQGLRFSDWTCSIAQLIALGFATILRAWVRRTMTKTPVAIPVDNDYILAHLTLVIVGRGPSDSIFPHHEAFRSPGLSLGFGISTCPELRVKTEEPTNLELPSTTNVQDSTEAEKEPNPTGEPVKSESPSTTNVQDLTEAERKPNPIGEPMKSESQSTTNAQDSTEAEKKPNPTREPINSESPSTNNVQDSPEAEKKINLAQEALNLRVRLGRITKWTGARSQEAIVLSNSIETALRKLGPRLPEEFGKKCAVVLPVDTHQNIPYLTSTSKSDSREEVELYLVKDDDIWKVDDGQLEALLSLVSYSVWAAKQNKRSEVETDSRKSQARSEPSEHLTKDSTSEDSQTIGWLRAKAPDSRIYDIIVGASSPRLTSDLRWWVPDTKQDLKKTKIGPAGKVTRVPADFTGASSDVEANGDKVERPALGFHVNDETLEKNGMPTIQRRFWRALTSIDIYCSWECDERQVSILHIFSTFIWATAPYLLASQFHPTTVITPKSRSERLTRSGLEEAHLKSDNIETLVQRLQSTGLATYEEIYKIFIPPLSHFGKLPNEAMADWCNEILIEREVRLSWAATFQGYIHLLDKVRDRDGQDRFSRRAAAMFVEFLLRVNEKPSPIVQGLEKSELRKFNKYLKVWLKNENILKVILSVKDLLARRWDPQKPSSARSILRKIGFENTLGKTQFRLLPLDRICPSDHTSSEEGLSFPNDTDVFGWTEEYWNIFETTDLVPASRFSECSALDVTGRSALHHKIDSKRYPDYNDEDMARFLFADRNYLGDSSMFIARCNKQTPLHRAAIVGHQGVINELLAQGIDPNAGDYFGRTTLCLALFHRHAEVIRMLDYKINSRDFRDRKDNNNRNALHYAFLRGEENLAISLIKRGIDFNAEDNFRRQPLWYAGWKKRDMVLEFLLHKDEIQRPIMYWRAPGAKYSRKEKACQHRIMDLDKEIQIQKWKKAQVAWEEPELERKRKRPIH